MSVRTRESLSARPPPPRSRPPPPPTFAPPPLPRTPSLNVYKRNEKQSQNEITDEAGNENQITVLPPKFKIEEVEISHEVSAQKPNGAETFNFTLKPRTRPRTRTNPAVPDREEQQVQSQQEQPCSGAAGEEDGDLVPQIRNKCNDVNEILNRILKSDDEFDMDNINEQDTEHDKDIKNTDDPFVNIDNIADLTLDEVREILENEEQTNAKLKDDLVSSKDEKLTKHKTEKLKGSEGSKVRPERSGARKSKKEQQLEKLKDFLKDPDGAEDQDVQLDIRMKKSDSEMEESSTDLTEITDTLYLASSAAVKNCQRSAEFSVVEVGDNSEPTFGNTNLHIQLKKEDDITKHHLQSVSNFVQENSRLGRKVVITSNLNTGIAACFCISYLVTNKDLTRRAAVSLVERVRPRASLPRAALLQIEGQAETERSRDQSLTSISQSWLPTVFFLLLLFLLVRTVFFYVGLDRKCVYQMFQILKQFVGMNS